MIKNKTTHQTSSRIAHETISFGIIFCAHSQWFITLSIKVFLQTESISEWLSSKKRFLKRQKVPSIQNESKVFKQKVRQWL